MYNVQEVAHIWIKVVIVGMWLLILHLESHRHVYIAKSCVPSLSMATKLIYSAECMLLFCLVTILVNLFAPRHSWL